MTDQPSKLSLAVRNAASMVELKAVQALEAAGGAALTAVEESLSGSVSSASALNDAAPASGAVAHAPWPVVLSDEQFAKLVELLTPGYECAQAMLAERRAYLTPPPATPAASDTIPGASAGDKPD